MPRNLTDLMEAAVSSAPPERHHAVDITHLAERRQRRRTTFVAGVAALAVVAAGGAGFGLTRGQGSTPEPAAPYKYGQELEVNDAVPVSSLPGFRVLPWTQPSLHPLSEASNSVPTYTGVDASGRLLVTSYLDNGEALELGTVRLYDAPGQAASPLREPASPPSGEKWIPHFTGDGRLLWTSTLLQGPPQGVNTIHVTDLGGGHDVSLNVGSVNSGVQAWVTGDQVWYEAQQSVSRQLTEIRRLYTESLSAGSPARLVARDVLAADVSDGRAAWVTTDGKVHVANADGTGVREVPVPFASGCTLTPAPQMSMTQAIAVARDAVAVTERCSSNADAVDELLAFDTRGRLLVHVKGFSVTAVTLSGSSLAVGGVYRRRSLENLVYNLRTGTLASFGRFGGQLAAGTPQVAGRYVLWYDQTGHVGEFAG